MNAELSHHLRKMGEKMKSQLRQPVRFKSSGGNVCRKSLTPEIKETAQVKEEKTSKRQNGEGRNAQKQISD